MIKTNYEKLFHNFIAIKKSREFLRKYESSYIRNDKNRILHSTYVSYTTESYKLNLILLTFCILFAI